MRNAASRFYIEGLESGSRTSKRSCPYPDAQSVEALEWNAGFTEGDADKREHYEFLQKESTRSPEYWEGAAYAKTGRHCFSSENPYRDHPSSRHYNDFNDGYFTGGRYLKGRPVKRAFDRLLTFFGI